MQWGSRWLYIGVGQRDGRGGNGHRSNGSEIEGRPDPRLKTRVPDGVPDGRAGRGRSNGGQDERLPNLRLQIMVLDGGAGRGDGWQNLRLKIKMSGGRANGGGEDEQRAERNA
jgi:hypothetical protein